MGLLGQREKGVGRDPPSSLGRKGDGQLCPLCPAAAGQQNRRRPWRGLCPSSLPFLRTPGLCNARRLSRRALPPAPGPTRREMPLRKLCQVFPPSIRDHCMVHAFGMAPSRSHREAFAQTLPAAGRTCILRRALLTVGSPSTYFTNKENSTILWQCQK